MLFFTSTSTEKAVKFFTVSSTKSPFKSAELTVMFFVITLLLPSAFSA